MTDTSTAASDLSPPRNRGPFVFTMMALAGLLFLSTASLLYYRWATTVEPNCILIINTTPALRGAEITVDGIALAKAHQVTVGDDDQYSQAFYLDPGTYDVRVKLNNDPLFSTSVQMIRWSEGTLDLTTLKPTTQP